jgi:hypothetical protein
MRRLATYVLAAITAAGLASAQPRPGICGAVRDATGRGMDGAVVTAWNQEDGLRRTAYTTPDGDFRMDSLAPGPYKISVRRVGFQTQVLLDFVLPPAGSDCLEFRMRVGSMHEVVTIHGGAAALNTSDGTLATGVDADSVRRLPGGERGVFALLELAAGAVVTPAASGEAGQFSVSGQRPNANSAEVDGVSANSGVGGAGTAAQFSGATLPAMTAFGSTQTLAALDEVDEVRFQTSSFAPEFGRLPGAVVSIWTRGGADQFHGAASLDWRNSALDANDWFADSAGLGRAAATLTDWSASLGGPIFRGRTHFFAVYQRLRLDQPGSLNAAVPSLSSRASAPADVQPFLAAFPLPTGASLGGGLSRLNAVYSRPLALDLGSLRIDHSFSSRLVAFARYQQTVSSEQSGYSQMESSRFSTASATLGITAVAGPSAVNDTRLHISRSAVSSDWTSLGSGGAPAADLASLFAGSAVAVTGPALYGFAIGGAGALYAGSTGPSRQGQMQLADTWSWNGGAHAIRLGVSYERLTPARDDAATAIAGAYWNLSDALAGNSPVLDVSQALQASSLIEMLSAFAQDTWRIHPRLTVTYGVRWELTPSPAVRAGSATSSSAGTSPVFPVLPGGVTPPVVPTPPASPPDSSTPFNLDNVSQLWPTRYTQLAPRIGVAYSLAPDTVVRAGAGVFYDAAFSAATDPVNGTPFNRWQFGAEPVSSGTLQAGPSAVYGVSYAPGLRLPQSREWNLSLEHQFAGSRLVRLSYVGSAGRDGLRRESAAAPQSQLMESLETTNDGRSSYHALQVQFQQRLTAHLQVIASYSYSHSIDNGSSDNAVYYSEWPWTAANDRGSSAFDIRHNLTAALDWALPFHGRLWGNWRLAAIARARSAFPLDVAGAENLLGLSFDDAPRPNLLPGVPLWIADAQVAGGRRLNPSAFALSSTSLQGNLGRDAIRGFGMSQTDLALEREFTLGEASRVALRMDAYNALNHPAFADPVGYLDSPFFGVPANALNSMLGLGTPHSGLAPALQIGGPRCLQVSVSVRF